jgi:flagella basal body P-ring formation protein FlgA
MRRAALLLVMTLVGAGRAGAGAPIDPAFEARVREAILAAVEARIGRPGATLDALAITATPIEGAIEATPAPDARIERPSLFSLTVATPQGPRRVGSAMATVSVIAEVVRARTTLARGAVVTPADVETWLGPIGRASLKRLPQPAEVEGAQAARAIEPGTVLTSDVLTVPPSVRSGQQVRLRAVVDGIVAHGVAIATENGRLGAVVRVVNPDSKRTIVGRVVGRGEVEVIHGS